MKPNQFKIQKPSQLQTRIEKIQLYGNDFRGKRYVNHEGFTEYQQFLYTKALHGLAVYTELELCEIPASEALQIIKTQKKTKTVFNIWKQEIINNYCANLFASLFPPEKECNKITREIINTVNDIDPDHDPGISFRKLGVSKKRMVQKLIDEQILPANFYSL